MNITVEKWLFRISQGNVVQCTGEVGNCTSYWC